MDISLGGNPVTFGSDSIEFGPDQELPTISISASHADMQYFFTAVVADNVGVAGVQFYINDVPNGAELVSAPWQLTWDASEEGFGNFNIYAIARDDAGNNRQSNSLQVSLVPSSGGAPLTRGGRHTYKLKNSIWQLVETA